MSAQDNITVMLEIFRAIERRDLPRIFNFCHADVEFLWPPSLPYAGTSRGIKTEGPTWALTWTPLQPTELERRMDPRVVAASDEEVVILWRQRGLSLTAERIDSPVLGLYRITQGKLARAQMFYFDTAAVGNFLASVKGNIGPSTP